MAAKNPLLTRELEIPFSSIEAGHVGPAITELLDTAKQGVRAIADHGGARTYANTMAELDFVTEPLEYAMGVAGHLESVATYPELREAYNAVQPDVAAFYSSIPLDAGLWNAIRALADTEEARGLEGARKRYLDKTIESFKRHGADLPDDGKRRLSEIDIELTKLTTKFGEHVLDSTQAFELVIDDRERLAGLPETAIEAARENAESKAKDGWRFTLQAPSYVPVMTYLEDRTIREQVYRAYATRATVGELDNRSIIENVIRLRREKAELLGFANFADFALEDRMAKTGAEAQSFLRTLRDKTLSFFERENEQLTAFARETEGLDDDLRPWDVSYYAEKQRKALYDFDEEVVRPYFAAEQVIEGLFETAKRLYGVTIEPRNELPTWDPAVRSYRMLDRDGTVLALFHLDIYPRENKRDGGWMHGLITGLPPEQRPHVALICANLNPPVGDRPALLTHREVETLFHEFGHLMHHCLSDVAVRGLAGTDVAWDFVELPSQIMENWCWEREALDVFASHYDSGEGLPADLFDRMKRARTYRAANAMMRQLGFAAVDLALHIDYEPERDGDVLAYSRQIIQDHSPAPLPDDHAMIAGFNHLFAHPTGYAAGYYSYKWAEVLDADAFSRFAREGVFSARVGQAFRDAILSRGNSRDPMALYREFMGREPELAPLLARSGLV